MMLKKLIFISSLFLFKLAQAASLDFSAVPKDILSQLPKESLQQKQWTLKEADLVLKSIAKDARVENASLVEIEEQKWKLVVIMQKKVAKIVFFGSQVISNNDLQEIFAISTDEVLEIDKIIEAAERIRLTYIDRGFLNPIIDVETPEVSPGFVELHVRINEGIRTFIRQWEIISENKDLNENLQKIVLSSLGPYSEKKIQQVLAQVRTELKNKKYLRAELQPLEARFNSDESQADLVLRIDKVETYKVRFIGNKIFSTQKIENDILQLQSFTTANPNPASEMSERIKSAYLALGYARVEIKVQEDIDDEKFIRQLDFMIDEGPLVRIQDIEVKGRTSRDSKYYATLIKESSTNLIQKNIYNKEELDQAIQNMLLKLQNQGYLLAKLNSSRTIYNREKDKLNIVLQLDEGPQTKVQDVSFNGSSEYHALILKQKIPLQKEGPLKLNEIENSIELIKNYYQNLGYIEVKILNQKEDLVVYNEDNTRAQIQFKILEGPRVTVGSILLDGNSFTRDNVILNELDFGVGDLFTPQKREESIARLQRTGHFGSVEIRTLEDQTQVEQRTIVVKVTERNPGVFTIGAGATNERELTLRGYTGVAYRNILGTGRGLSLRFEGNYNVKDIKYLETKISLGYLEPYLFQTRNRFRLNMNRQKLISDYDKRRVTEANQVVYSIERDFTSHIVGAWDLWNLTTFNDFYLIANQGEDSRLNIAMTTLKVDIDYRDNPFNTSRGHLINFAIDYSSPQIGSSSVDEFWRTSGSLTTYYPFAPRWVWANSLRGRYLKSLSGGLDGGVPFEKMNFTLGGRSTIRGFEGTSEVFPNSRDLGTNSYRLKTSATLGLIKSELRFPLFGDSFDGAVFYDGGAVEIENLVIADTYRDSFGVGVRYVTPVGPISLELAQKLDRREGEDPWRFHLSVGVF